MAELDLVPGDYRRRLQQQRTLWGLGGAYLVVLGLLVLGRGGIAFAAKVKLEEQTRIESERAQLEMLEARRDALQGEQKQLSARSRALESLRGGLHAHQTFWVIDRALSEDVWFTSLAFRRAGEWVDPRSDGVETGYFIVVPESADEGQGRAWELRTHMEVHGRARDHSALAGFVQGLLAQPEVRDVRVLNTRSQPQTGMVDFETAVVLAAGGTDLG